MEATKAKRKIGTVDPGRRLYARLRELGKLDVEVSLPRTEDDGLVNSTRIEYSVRTPEGNIQIGTAIISRTTIQFSPTKSTRDYMKATDVNSLNLVVSPYNEGSLDKVPRREVTRPGELERGVWARGGPIARDPTSW